MVIVYVGVVAMDRHRVSGLLLAAPGTDCLRRARSRAQLHASPQSTPASRCGPQTSAPLHNPHFLHRIPHHFELSQDSAHVGAIEKVALQRVESSEIRESEASVRHVPARAQKFGNNCCEPTFNHAYQFFFTNVA